MPLLYALAVYGLPILVFIPLNRRYRWLTSDPGGVATADDEDLLKLGLVFLWPFFVPITLFFVVYSVAHRLVLPPPHSDIYPLTLAERKTNGDRS